MEPSYTFTFTPDDAKLLWQCLQSAPLPRGLTDNLAAAFLAQLNENNERIMRERAGQANGQEHTRQ